MAKLSCLGLFVLCAAQLGTSTPVPSLRRVSKVFHNAQNIQGGLLSDITGAANQRISSGVLINSILSDVSDAIKNIADEAVETSVLNTARLDLSADVDIETQINEQESRIKDIDTRLIESAGAAVSEIESNNFEDIIIDAFRAQRNVINAVKAAEIADDTETTITDLKADVEVQLALAAETAILQEDEASISLPTVDSESQDLIGSVIRSVEDMRIQTARDIETRQNIIMNAKDAADGKSQRAFSIIQNSFGEDFQAIGEALQGVTDEATKVVLEGLQKAQDDEEILTADLKLKEVAANIVKGAVHAEIEEIIKLEKIEEAIAFIQEVGEVIDETMSDADWSISAEDVVEKEQESGEADDATATLLDVVIRTTDSDKVGADINSDAKVDDIDGSGNTLLVAVTKVSDSDNAVNDVSNSDAADIANAVLAAVTKVSDSDNAVNDVSNSDAADIANAVLAVVTKVTDSDSASEDNNSDATEIANAVLTAVTKVADLDSGSEDSNSAAKVEGADIANTLVAAVTKVTESDSTLSTETPDENSAKSAVLQISA